MSFSVLIADDEPHARDFLAQLVTAHPAVDLAGVCENGNTVLKFCKTLVPDILLLDIQMPGLNGIEAAKKLLVAAKRPVIVFTTAYDQYAIEAFEVEAVGYLLKPFSQEQFSSAVDRAIDQCSTKEKVEFEERIQRLFDRFKGQKATHLDRIELKEKGLIKTVHTSDVRYFSADSEYVRIHTAKTFYLYRIALELLDQQLGPEFLRIHRSHIINLNRVASWQYRNNGTYAFSFDDGNIVPSSRSYQSAIQEKL